MDSFFVGIHDPHIAHYFRTTFISVNRLRRRKRTGFKVGKWIMDSGAFTEISRYGDYRTDVAEYAGQIEKWAGNGELLAAVGQDYMCEPFILEKTGMTVEEHQEKTVARYDELLRYEPSVPIIPVLQGYAPGDYVRHLVTYGDRLRHGAWVGVGSICKRNTDPAQIISVLSAIKHHRSDLLLHGFGLKITALTSSRVRALLHTSDSMAWSYHARMHGKGGNDWREAMKMVVRVDELLASDLIST